MDKLGKEYQDKHKIYVIKTGVFHELLVKHADNAQKYSKNQCGADLNTYCELMPKYFYPHFQRVRMNEKHHPSKELEQIMKCFPNERKWMILGGRRD